MKRLTVLALAAALLSFTTAGLAAANDCACQKAPGLSGPSTATPAGLRPGIDAP